MNFKAFRCEACEKEYEPKTLPYRCPECNEPVFITYDYPDLKKRITPETFSDRSPSIWKYRELLPIDIGIDPVSMGEGDTPFIRAEGIERRFGLSCLFLLDEGRNPTGAYKDRGTSVGITASVERGIRAVGTLSHGNMGTSTAAYAAKSGRTCFVLVPEYIIASRLTYISSYGARVLKVAGRYDLVYNESLKIARKCGVMFINADNPFRAEGTKTIAFDIVKKMGWKIPDWVISPTSSGGLASALYKGFNDLKEIGLISKIPKVAVIQPEEAQPIVRAFKTGQSKLERVKHPFTSIVRSMGNPNPPSGNHLLMQLRRFGGTALAVSDAEVIDAQRNLARLEGILTEPAGAITLAGLQKLITEESLDPEQSVVAILSGFGFRDPGDADRLMDTPESVTLEDLESIIADESY